MISGHVNFVFDESMDFIEKTLAVFRFQYAHNMVYKRYVDSLNCKPENIKNLSQIPFLPISFFKTHQVTCTEFEAELLFESSGTTASVNSKHFVKDAALYQKSFIRCFEQRYGPIDEYCILGLLPSYLERQNSSLVYMVKQMMEMSSHPFNGFFITNHEELKERLLQLQTSGQQTLLIGVTYALIDFATVNSIRLNNTIIMETGGMKGRKKEMLRAEVHEILKKSFAVQNIHSEYGMTELLSQAYSSANGIFQTPHWMKVLVREEDDPFSITAETKTAVTGAINVIDLANIYSCSFIATEDAGKLHADGSFEVLGRLDQSDIRGCSLMAI